MITGKLYDRLKWLAQVVLPALATLYFTIGGIWGLPSVSEVVRTIVAVDLFIGVLLGISQVNYNKQVANGDMHVEDTGSGTRFTLELDGDPSELPDKQEARFRVKKEREATHED
jgi:hypothetical protein